jgi:hypothetical protein
MKLFIRKADRFLLSDTWQGEAVVIGVALYPAVLVVSVDALFLHVGVPGCHLCVVLVMLFSGRVQRWMQRLFDVFHLLDFIFYGFIQFIMIKRIIRLISDYQISGYITLHFFFFD